MKALKKLKNIKEDNKMQSVITGEMLQGFEEKFEKDPVNRVAMNAAVKNGINASADNFRARIICSIISFPNTKITT